jgi:hypothetical protein
MIRHKVPAVCRAESEAVTGLNPIRVPLRIKFLEKCCCMSLHYLGSKDVYDIPVIKIPVGEKAKTVGGYGVPIKKPVLNRGI